MFNNTKPQVVVVDDFLADPDRVRQFALELEYKQKLSKGLRTVKNYHDQKFIPVFESLLHIKISDWDLDVNGRYQYCTSEDPIVFHTDLQTHAGIIYLTPDAPVEAGTSLLRSKKFRLRTNPDSSNARASGRTSAAAMRHEMFGGFYDPTLWEEVDRLGNLYNRLVLWPGRYVHAASCYFGQNIRDARLFQVFFFNGK